MTYFNRGGGFGGGRNSNRSGFGGGSDRSDLYKAVCAECGKDCQVPFRPTGTRPVYCSECFEAQNGGSDRGPRRESQNSFRGGRQQMFDRRPSFDSYEPKQRQSQVSEEHLRAINIKLDRILDLLSKRSVSDDTTEVVEKKVAKTKAIKKLIKKNLEEVSEEAV